ncbi:uncharacterized protein [Dermacentor albipictus]|uniref:uncharacterized protein n=1 Tax=Dermacentor albipictus TaxID=60249 RepID=UPI0038FC5DD2
MANESYYDLSIMRTPRLRPTPLLAIVGNQEPALPGTPVAVPRARLPTKPVFSPCGWLPSDAAGCHPDYVDPCSGGVSSSLMPQTRMAQTNVAPEFTASSVENAAPMTLDSKREQQPLLQPEAEAAFAQDGPDSKANTLQYFLIGVLFAGLVTAAVLATANAPGGPLSPHDLLPEEERRSAHPMPRPSYHVPQDVQGQELLVVPSLAQQPPPVVAGPMANQTRNGLRNSTEVSSVDRRKTAQHLAQLESAEAEKYGGEECRRYYYTYCRQPAHRFHYDPERRVCVPTSEDGGQLCNHGSNRFRSWESCRASCLQRDRVSDKCLDNTLFIPCTRKDIVTTFWYFDGRACTTWDFPRGNCPQSRAGVYETFRECFRQCKGKGREEAQADSARCSVPEPGACGLEELKYPFFADMQAEGSARCSNASRAALLARRCLVGSNQFHSLDDCQGACLD